MTLQFFDGVIDPLTVNIFAERFAGWFDWLGEDGGTQSGIALIGARHQDLLRRQALEDFRAAVKFCLVWRRLYANGPLYWLADMASVRRQKSDEPQRGLGWHQDSAVVNPPRGWGVQGFVVWLPLTPIDASTPGLQVKPWRPWTLRHKGNPANGYFESRYPYGRTQTICDLPAGSVAVFNIRCPHRTWVTESMTRTRMSVDLRVVKRVPRCYRGDVIQVA